jgi:hypothetical protein
MDVVPGSYQDAGSKSWLFNITVPSPAGTFTFTKSNTVNLVAAWAPKMETIALS